MPKEMSVVRMIDYDQYDWAVSRGYLSMGNWQGEQKSYRQGVFRHPIGLVEVYEQIGSCSYVSLRFRHAGRDHCRSWKTSWGDKTIARLAREFVGDVVR